MSKKQSLTKEQILAIKCAHADLIGALQAWEQGESNIHDWDAHKKTIMEMQDAFDFLEEYEAVDK